MKIRHYSLGEFERDIEILASKIIADNYTALYGVPRGGIPVALALSKITGLPLTEWPEEEDDSILVVDDLVDSGATRDKYHNNDFACLHIKDHTPALSIPEYYIDKKSCWIEYWWETNETPIEDSITRLIEYIGDDPNREGLLETPSRIIKSYNHLFSGYDKDQEQIFKTFESGSYDQMILLKDIEFYSTCEHHMIPFFGSAYISYIPNGKVIGISKLARLLEIYTRRLQIQERIGEQITNDLMKYLNPIGAACILKSKHLCMCARGVQKQNSLMITSSLKGAFLTKLSARQELMRLIN